MVASGASVSPGLGESSTPRDRTKARKSVLLVVGACISLSACGDGGQDGGGASAGPTGSTILSNQGLRSAINEAIAEFDEDESVLLACLTDAGFDYEPRTVTVALADPNLGLVSSLDRLRRWGYGISVGEGTNGITVSQIGGNVPDDQRDAFLLAIGEGGACFEYASVTDIATEVEALQNEFGDLPDDFASNPVVVEALRNWTECMSSRGYTYDSPLAVFEDLDQRFGAAQSSDDRRAFEELELRIASADADCQEVHVFPALRSLTGGP